MPSVRSAQVLRATSEDGVRYLLIVQRGDSLLHQQVTKMFASRPYVQVMYDRREQDRRRTTVPPGVERRRADRRARSWADTEIRECGAAMVRLDPA